MSIMQKSEGNCPKCNQPLAICGTCHGCALESMPSPNSASRTFYGLDFGYKESYCVEVKVDADGKILSYKTL